MSSVFLFDTNIFIAIQNQEMGVVRRLDGIKAYLSIVVLGELLYGAKNSDRIQPNLESVEHLEAIYPLLQCDRQTALIYAQIKVELKTIGRPIPENDTWIAAQARQYDLTLVTRDAHFQHVSGITTAAW